MFESLMFWKKKEEPTSSFSSSSSSQFNQLDVQSPPNFGDANSAMNNGGLQTGMNSSGNLNQIAPNPYPTGFDSSSSSSNGIGSTADPFASPMSNSQSGFGQTNYSNNALMQQLQGVPTNPISTLPSRSVQSDPNAIHPRDVELILSRLELIRAEIENVNHRLSHLEQAQLQEGSGTGRGRLAGAKAKNWY